MIYNKLFIFLISLSSLFLGCSTNTPQQDPLKNTKKLVREGHVSLYENGAFRIPKTSIHLIPAGPTVSELSYELAGMKAKESFLQAVQEAKEVSVIVVDGTELTLEMTEATYDVGQEIAKNIEGFVRPDSVWIMQKSETTALGIIDASWEMSKQTWNTLQHSGDALTETTSKAADRLQEDGTQVRESIVEGGQAISDDLSQELPQVSSNVKAALSESGEDLSQSSIQAGKEIYDSSQSQATQVSQAGTEASEKLFLGSIEAAQSLSEASDETAASLWKEGSEAFIVGYAVLPQKLEQHGKSMSDAELWGKFEEALEESEQWRQESEKDRTDITTIFSDAANERQDSFDKGAMAMDQISEEGTFAMLKGLGWFVQGVFWDSVIKPVGKTTAASLGYVTTNAVIYPAMVVVKEGIAATHVAVQVSWDSAKAGYDIVAPTGKAALYGLLSATSVAAGNTAAVIVGGSGAIAAGTAAVASDAAAVAVAGSGAAVAGATIAGGAAMGQSVKATGALAKPVVQGTGAVVHTGINAAGHLSGYAVEGGAYVTAGGIKSLGWATGKATQYVAAPLASTGIAVGGGMTGVVVGGAGITTGATLRVSGEATAGASKVGGAIAAGTTFVGGMVTTVAVSGGILAYQVAKGVTVPPSYVLGSGLVLSYGSLTHLGAHTILGVADAAYLVLSLEGPNWVIYAVKGDLLKDQDLPPGTVVDLETLQSSGETIYRVPVSEEELDAVHQSLF